MEDLDWLLDWFKRNSNIVRFQALTPIPKKQDLEIRNRISKFYFAIKNDFPEYAERLFELKNNLSLDNGMVNVSTFCRLDESLSIIKILINNAKISKWTYIHEKFQGTVKQKFLLNFYKESINEATDILMLRLKYIDSIITGIEVDIDGNNLIEKLFSEKDTKIQFCNTETRTGKNIQRGYTSLFRGWILSIRNRNAHPGSYNITEVSAFRELVFISMLMSALDNRLNPAFLGNE